MNDCGIGEQEEYCVPIWFGDAGKLAYRQSDTNYFTKREKRRMEAFRFSSLREFYAIVHASVGRSMARFYKVRQEAVSLDQLPCPRCGSAEHGPPCLQVAEKKLWFSLSKSDPLFIFTAFPAPIGIDIELWQKKSLLYLGNDTFSPSELSKIRQSSDGQLALRYWVRKEAVVKAQGIGIVDPLHNVDVSHTDDRGSLSSPVLKALGT